jgi:hypothetical protein
VFPFRAALLVLTVAVAALVSPLTATAKPKKPEPLYTLSLSGSISVEQAEVQKPVVEIPNECKGEWSEAVHLTWSTQIDPVSQRLPLIKYGHFRFFSFKAALQGLTATGSSDLTGHLEPDPSFPLPIPPGACTFTPQHLDAHCTFAPEATSPKGPDWSLFAAPKDGYKFILGHAHSFVEYCDQSPLQPPSSLEEFPTKLTVGKVLAMRRGASLTESVSFTDQIPPHTNSETIPGSAHGTETVAVTLKIRRVR